MITDNQLQKSIQQTNHVLQKSIFMQGLVFNPPLMASSSLQGILFSSKLEDFSVEKTELYSFNSEDIEISLTLNEASPFCSLCHIGQTIFYVGFKIYFKKSRKKIAGIRHERQLSDQFFTDVALK